MSTKTLQDYRAQVHAELTNNILAFYLNHAIDQENGGFHGFIANDLTMPPNPAKALIQNSRILWTFAQASRLFGRPDYQKTAERAYDYLLSHFWDDEFGGLFWLLDVQGQPQDTTKWVYGQAFGIYGLSEYYLATGNLDSCERAIELYRLLEECSRDADQGGYFEAYRRDWTPLDQVSIDEVAAVKTMNTHLHIMEAYTNLLRAWEDVSLRTSLRQLIVLTLERIVDPHSGHFKLHLDAAWQPLNGHISYGHDIEGSWLLYEAAEVLGEADLLAEVQPIALKMAEATLQEGIDADGSVLNEGDPTGLIDDNKDWWPQAEAMVGFLNAYQLTGESRYLEASLNCWNFARQFIIDPQHGEWLWGVARQGQPYRTEKTSPWKAPYHNGRACMEVICRITDLLGVEEAR